MGQGKPHNLLAQGGGCDYRRQIIQPSEFILGPGNTVLASSYSDGPVGRMLAPDALSLIKIIAARST